MRKIVYTLIAAVVLFACDDENLFDTVEAPAPQVSSTNWTATAVDASGTTVYTTGFAEGGRLFRLPAPDNDSTSTVYRDITISTLINSGDSRSVDSVTVWTRWIPSFPSNSPQPWIIYDGISVATRDQAPAYQIDYTLNLDAWADDYICAAYGACGFGIGWSTLGPLFGINIIREDNMMRFTVHFDDGTQETIAQVQMGLPITAAGLQ